MSCFYTRFLRLMSALERILIMFKMLWAYILSVENVLIIKISFKDPNSQLWGWFLHNTNIIPPWCYFQNSNLVQQKSYFKICKFILFKKEKCICCSKPKQNCIRKYMYILVVLGKRKSSDENFQGGQKTVKYQTPAN